jgi:hypothetical protein
MDEYMVLFTACDAAILLRQYLMAMQQEVY